MSNLAEIGQTLKQAREQRGLSLDDAAEATRLSRRYLVFLEEGNTLQLPEPVYIKSFIKKYANYLGLPGNEIASQYEYQPPTTQTSQDIEGSHWGWLPLTATALLLAALGVAWWVSRPAPKQVAIQPSPTPIHAVQATASIASTSLDASASLVKLATASGLASPSTEAPAVATSSISKLNLTLRATADCWVEVVADGKTIYSEVVKSNHQVNWTAKKKMLITLGNAGGANLNFNNKNIGTIGKTGEVATRAFMVEE